MSISTPSGEQKSPSSVKVTGKPSAKPGAKPSTPSGKGKGSGPKKQAFTPVKVNQGRNWGPIALFTAVGLLAAGIIGWGAWAAFRPGGAGYGWETRAKSISGIQDFRGTELKRDHSWEPQKYAQNPPVGGTHIPPPVWQQCMGNVYDAPIPNEHAVHSMEHGAVWLTYRSDLPADQVETLKKKINGKQFTMMSPVDGLDKAVSLQAWGWQLKLDNPSDSRIDDFVGALAKNASVEPGATCTGGATATGTTPFTEQQAQQKFGGQQ
ncbi:MAG TPA: hypothetical protein DGG94_10670 [Micromonosporaceae bacterium]|nr:hypothetical protein [Micromonosporaceae bacterium]HCU50242.1 hypothetical protein [Micromonosporaceae bacterium]